MKLSIDRDQLQQGLARIQSIVDKRNSMPILANALLEAKESDEGGSISIAATDLEVGVRGLHPAKVEIPGRLTVSAKKLFEIVRELPDEPIQLEATANSYLAIASGRSTFSLAGTSAEEYPTMPSFTPGKTVFVQAGVLAAMIDRTMYAASVDETRYNLNGVYLEVLEDTGRLRMVSTDGHRLARVDREMAIDPGAIESGVIIPRKGLAELRRLADEDDAEEIELAFEGNNGLARKGEVVVVMRLIEGQFPNYSQVVPSEVPFHLTLATEVLTHALRRTLLFSGERSHAVRLELSGGNLILSSSSPDLGEAREEIEVDYGEQDLTIGFNARYLLDALGSMKAKEVRLGFETEQSPATLSPADDNETLAVVMPMRL